MEKFLYFPTELQVGDLVTFTNGDIAKVLDYKPSFKENLFDIKIKFVSNNKIT
nr:hypothetical protein [uncultured Flavobacterium sp.]